MKYLLILFILSTLSLFSQDFPHVTEKGVTPVTGKQRSETGSTYAVVVGISDYQDEDIPDLRFADKDALAFAGFLQSPAGGSLDEDHLKVLINEQATVAQFAIALDWLWEVVKENDRAIIYFSGHGDVERKSLTQPGFLLCWDAPAKIYLAGGTLALPMFQEVISTLSIQNKAKVIVITDACRSGKLSGSSVGGAQLTSNNLAKQYANEIKILSCQPDEFSIEGEQWGGGRGAFSYHLLDGLSGMADDNEDLNVNLKEIGRYLEDRVTEEVAPQSQNPMVIGNKTEKLADVFPEILAQLKEGKKGHMQLFTSTESRGIEDEVLAAADTSIVEMYHAFKKALKDKQFLFAEKDRPENDYAEFYYAKLSQEPQLERLHSSMRRNYAAALQDDAQQVMNDWMKSDEDLAMEAGEKKGRLPIKVFTQKIKAFPACLERAAELLGEDHYMYTTLLARKHFFKGYLLANSDRNPNKELGNKALAEFRQALQFQPEQPQAYWQMIDVYGYNFLQPDSAEFYALKAMRLHPSWIKPYVELVFLFTDKYKLPDQAKPYLEQAMQIDSTSVPIMNAWGNYFRSRKEYDEAEKYYKKTIQLDSTHSPVYNNLGLVYSITRRYDEAEKYLKKAIQLDSTNSNPPNNLGIVYSDTRRYKEAEEYYKKAIQLDSTDSYPFNNLGVVYNRTRRYKEAEKYLKIAIQLDSTFANPYYNLGLVYRDTRRYKEAEKYLKKAIQLDSTNTDPFFDLGNVYSNTHRYDKAEKYYQKVIQLEPTNANAYNNLGTVYTDTRRYDKAEKCFKIALQPDSTFWAPNANLGVLYQVFQRWKESETVIERAIQFGPPIGELVAMLGNAYTHMNQLDKAKEKIDKGLQMSPDSPDILIYLSQWYVMQNQLDQAWVFLEQGLENGFGNGELKIEDLQEGPDFEEMRKDPKWDQLMQKYFPDESKK